jgi:hypothetical protein
VVRSAKRTRGFKRREVSSNVELQMDDSTASQYGYTLDTMAAGGHEAVAWLLVEHGADVNSQGG